MINFNLDNFDLNMLQDVKEIAEERFAEMIECYIEDGRKYINEIKDGFANNDKNKVAQNAHPLKSASRLLGGIAMGDITEHIELTAREAIKNDTDIEELKLLLPQLDQIFNSTSEKLKDFLRS